MKIIPLRLSVSQIKKANKSKAEWAGSYILGIKERFDNINTIMGNMFHLWVEHGNDIEPMKFLNKFMLDKWDRAEVLEKYNNLKNHYAYYTDIHPGKHEVKVDYTYMDLPGVAYIDFVTIPEEGEKAFMKDWKTVGSFCDPESKRLNPWSGLNTYEEYELQAWQYMIATGYTRADFVEFLKKAEVYKKVPKAKQKTHSVGDRKIAPEDSVKVTTFLWSEEWNNKMKERFDPVIEEMIELHAKFTPYLKSGATK